MMNRRHALNGIALAGTAGLTVRTLWRPRLPQRAPSRSTVAVLRCPRYNACATIVDDGLRLLGVDVRNKRVVLKPNLVEYSPTAPINTHPILIAATVDALYRAGAATVTVADGPGHVRDAEMLLEESGLGDQLAAVGRSNFVDLNFDAVRPVTPKGGLTDFRQL